MNVTAVCFWVGVAIVATVIGGWIGLGLTLIATALAQIILPD